MVTITDKNIGQARAAFAYQCAEKGVADSNYKPYVRKTPALIKTNGLSAAFAFFKAKGNKASQKAYAEIYKHVHLWLVQSPVNHTLQIKRDEDLVKQLIGLPSDQYRMATMEVLAFMVWLARFADGLDQSEGDGHGE